MELGELHRTIHGRTAEREVASGEMYRKTRKHASDAMSFIPPPGNPPTLIGSGSTSLSSLYLQIQNVRSGSPRAGPSRRLRRQSFAAAISLFILFLVPVRRVRFFLLVLM